MDGCVDGTPEGCLLGWDDGFSDGIELGCDVGELIGCDVGSTDGFELGCCDGSLLGLMDNDGLREGIELMIFEGDADGIAGRTQRYLQHGTLVPPPDVYVIAPVPTLSGVF